MAESTTQPQASPDTLAILKAEEIPALPANISPPPTSPSIIWTPKFIVSFSLILIIGLSAASPLTQIWLNRAYPAGSVYLLYLVFISSCLITTVLLTRSLWIRLGAIFGCIWALIVGSGFALSLLAIDVPPPFIAQHLHAAANTALLGASICLSIAYTTPDRWDTWFFRFTPILGSISVIAFYLLAPAELRSFDYFESSIALVALYFSALIWWIRPSCWKAQPGPTFFFGLVSVILLVLTLPNGVDNQTSFLFTQILLLCFLLGSLRILQAERR